MAEEEVSARRILDSQSCSIFCNGLAVGSQGSRAESRPPLRCRRPNAPEDPAFDPAQMQPDLLCGSLQKGTVGETSEGVFTDGLSPLLCISNTANTAR